MADNDDAPQHRYGAALAAEIEQRWQDRWETDRVFFTPNRTGLLSEDPRHIADRPSLFVLDMFPYPSGAGLHVGHPLGYIATDVYARYMRMSGRNVLHAMGYDAFGLPAEQYAVQTGTHPRVTTEENVAKYARQLRALGLGHDPRRGPSTTDVAYYRWTQWIFLQIYNSWYDEEAGKARPIAELVEELRAGKRFDTPDGIAFDDLGPLEQRRLVDSYRLAYVAEAPVNWCPGLGTVLANEEVTADGRSERGNFPVYRRPLKQWMLRITAYADRLIDDLDLVDWSESIKLMQRNWIGRSMGALAQFPVEGHEDVHIEVFTTRPDTLFGATYMVLAPEHPLLDTITANEWPDDTIGSDWSSNALDTWKGLFGATDPPPVAVRRYREFAAEKTDLERQTEGREKTGVFTGAFAINPTNRARIPIFVADYVLMGYGTGAIMAVPAHDQRDFEFAREFELPITGVIRPSEEWMAERVVGVDAEVWPEGYVGDGFAMNSTNEEVSLDGLTVEDAKRVITEWLEKTGRGKATITYKLRDWLFSRQRYWGEPFPIVYDDAGPIALPDAMLPVVLPEVSDFEPTTSDDPDALPEPPLARAVDWVEVELDLPGPAWTGGGGGRATYLRETNTMPQWAGSCWYYLRYLDPTNEDAMVDPAVERAWAEGTRADGSAKAGLVDLYVGGVEHAVLHLLYARFWHKVLYDLGHVSTREPFQRLVNQGYILAPAYQDDRGMYVDADMVEARDGGYFYQGKPVVREFGKMGKSLHNSVSPDDIYRDYGADTLRLYEMFMGPLEKERPWNTSDISGVHRFLQRLWRNLVDETTGEISVADEPADDETRRVLHRTIAAVRDDMAAMSFNTAIARLFELNNHLTAHDGAVPREVAEPFVLMVAPLAPHVAEELWSRLGHADTLAYEPFPVADPALVVDEFVEVPVQINGKVRARIKVPVGADEAAHEAAARADARIAELLTSATVRKLVIVPGRTVNFVVA